MTVLRAILAWSQKRPAWQRDALRRLLKNGTVAQTDIDELVGIAAQSHGLQLREEPPPQPILLSLADLPPVGAGSGAVRLLAIRETLNVNALVPGQTLSFGDVGMTVVYGDNGAGKSGYARILRRACRARSHGSAILPNVFAKPSSGAAEAKIDYGCGDQAGTLHWRDAGSAAATLSPVSFFDSECASIHVGKANDLAYTPFGLDLLPKLVDICQAVRKELAKSRSDVEGAGPKSLAAPVAATGTAVRTALDGVSASSDLQSFAELAAFDAKDSARMKTLSEDLRADPLAAASEFELKAERILRLAATLRSVEGVLSELRIAELRSALQEEQDARTAARVAAEDAFSGQPLDHVGSETWTRLWEAARRYSEAEAYPSTRFPLLGPEARCVLCQELLPETAKERLRGFDAFVRGDLKGSLAKAEEAVAIALRDLRSGELKRADYRDSLGDLELLDSPLALEVRSCLASSIRRYRALRTGRVKEGWQPPPEMRGAPLARLSELHAALVKRGITLRASASASDREALRGEYRELQGREWLAGILGDVALEIERRRQLDSLDKAIAETQTTAITNFSSKLTDQYVTGAVSKRFETEVKDLGGAYLRIKLESAGGTYGQKRLRVAFDGAAPDVAVPAILSEGESTCIALAGFFAELATESTGSGLVFDDPVSSLDHGWRRGVAERLVREARERQVIVFTHDLVFLLDVVELCEAVSTPLRLTHLERTATGAGLCVEGVPWGGMGTKARIGVLRSRIQQTETVYNKDGQVYYAPLARDLYGLLRETWERAVEEVLLDGAVMRFQRGVQTKQLSKLTDITQADLDAVDKGMTKASRFLRGHDASASVNEPVPGPDELRADIDALADWAKSVRKRRD